MAKAPARPSVQQEVMKWITRLMQKRPSPARAVMEAEAIAADLRREGDEDQVRSWLEEMRDGFAEASEQAAEAVDEVEATKKVERAAAENAAVCLREIGRTFGKALNAPVPA